LQRFFFPEASKVCQSMVNAFATGAAPCLPDNEVSAYAIYLQQGTFPSVGKGADLVLI